MDKHDDAHYEDMRTDPPNWTTLYNGASSSQHRALDTPLPNTSPVRQEKDCLMDVDCLDALQDHQRQDNDSMRACVGYQELNASYLQPVINAPPLTRFPVNDGAMYQSGSPMVRLAQPRDGSKRGHDSRARNNANNFKTRKRVRPPSLPCSASPSPSPSPSLPPARLRLRTPPHRPDSKAKSKAKVRTSEISNIDAYAFKGFNRQEAKDEEWSTLPPRKKAKTKMYAIFLLL